ncbi:Ig-like domain-containing protein, partial [Lacihabitans soyangensis]
LNNPIGVPVVINIISNDTLSSGFNPTASQVSVDLNPSLPGIQNTLTVAGEGVYVYDSLTGNVTFTPEPTFVTDPSPIDYVLIEKSTGLDSTATIVITVVEEQPIAVNDSSLNNPYGSIIVINIIENDTLSNGLTPTANQVTVDLDVNTPGIQDTLIVTGEGVFVYDSLTGQVTFTPETNFVNNPSPIVYTLVEKTTGLTDQASIIITYIGADLSLTKSVNMQNVNVGDTLTFTINIRNAGPAVATNVQIKDALPKGYSNISNITSNGIYLNDTITWEINSLNVNADTSFTYNVIVNAPTGSLDEYKNVAQITAADQLDPNSTPNNNIPSENDQDSVTPNIQIADLSIEKSINNSSPQVGEVVAFSIKIKNNGPDNASGVDVIDYLPNGFGSISNISNAGTIVDTTIIWNNLSVNNGDSLTVTFNAVVLPFSQSVNYTNTSEIISSNQYDPDSRVNNFNGVIAEDEESLVCVFPGTLSDTTLCEGENLVFTIDQGQTYQWSGPNGFTSTSNTFSLTNIGIVNAGVYNVLITNGACSITKSFNLTVTGKPNVVVEATNSGCQGSASMNNGRIRISGFAIGSNYQLSPGAVFNVSSATNLQSIPLDGIIKNDVTNTNQSFTVRVFNTNNCFRDYRVDFVEIDCQCPAEICIPFIIKKVK